VDGAARGLKRAARMTRLIEESWWLDRDSDDDHQTWARFRYFSDKVAVVLDADGQRHRFDSYAQAQAWFTEHRYVFYRELEDADLPGRFDPPEAESDDALIPKMRVRREAREETSVPVQLDPAQITEEVILQHIRNGQTVAAVALYRAKHGVGLKVAFDAVNALIDRLFK
jgi:hypothetical protein